MEEYYRSKLGEILVAAGRITEEQLNQALDQQHQSGRRLGSILRELPGMEDADILEARALQMDVPHIHLDPSDIPPDVVQIIPERMARECRLVPVSATDSRIALAMADPMDMEALDMVQRYTRRKAHALFASESAIQALIDSVFGQADRESISASVDEAIGEMDVSMEEDQHEEMDLGETRRASEQAPIVRLVNLILKGAAEAGASDIHVEPRRTGCLVRYRIDGALREVRSIPKSIQAAVLSRLKILGDVDISEKRVPQDGRFAINVGGRSIDIRLSTLPIQYGERIVMRLLDRGAGARPLDSLGFEEDDLARLNQMIHHPYGIILCTGPTGSGKSSTLYSFITAVRSPEVNIITVEDPVEYELEGASQSNVNVRAGLTFAAQLRAILRQDPDIIMVGEIRDGETADIAFRASLTGHLVFSTLHCNDSTSAFARLTDMGVEPYLPASALTGVVAQRLVRTICPRCRESYEPEEEESLVFEQAGMTPPAVLHRGVGCKNCAQTGFKGRALVCEVLSVTPEIRKLALARASSGEIREEAIRSGMRLMGHNALQKVQQGLTTLQEVNRKVFLSED